MDFIHLGETNLKRIAGQHLARTEIELDEWTGTYLFLVDDFCCTHLPPNHDNKDKSEAIFTPAEDFCFNPFLRQFDRPFLTASTAGKLLKHNILRMLQRIQKDATRGMTINTAFVYVVYLRNGKEHRDRKYRLGRTFTEQDVYETNTPNSKTKSALAPEAAAGPKVKKARLASPQDSDDKNPSLFYQANFDKVFWKNVYFSINVSECTSLLHSIDILFYWTVPKNATECTPKTFQMELLRKVLEDDKALKDIRLSSQDFFHEKLNKRFRIEQRDIEVVIHQLLMREYLGNDNPEISIKLISKNAECHRAETPVTAGSTIAGGDTDPKEIPDIIEIKDQEDLDTVTNGNTVSNSAATTPVDCTETRTRRSKRKRT